MGKSSSSDTETTNDLPKTITYIKHDWIESIVSGYISQIAKMTIPEEIVFICIAYYELDTILYYMIHYSYRLQITTDHFKMKSINTEQTWDSCKIKSVTETSDHMPLSLEIDTKTALHFESRLYLDDSTTKKLRCTLPNYSTDNNIYDTIFICGGYYISPHSVIFFESKQFYRKYTDIIYGYHFELPILKTISNDSWISSITYSNTYGLLAVAAPYVYQLEFDKSSMNTNIWHNWKRLPAMKNHREQPLITVVKLNMNEKLIVLGGWRSSIECDTTMEIYDFEKKEWSLGADLKINREASGLYYDQMNQLVYVGGGKKKASHSVECYDIYKNKWWSLPDTLNRYCDYPLLWRKHNLLYIAANRGMEYDYREYIDLRVARNKGTTWTSVATSMEKTTHIRHRWFL
eukprot:207608_1